MDYLSLAGLALAYGMIAAMVIVETFDGVRRRLRRIKEDRACSDVRHKQIIEWWRV